MKIITKKLPKLSQKFERLNLQVLDKNSALELLKSLIDEPNKTSRVQEELDVAKALCEMMGYLPLGLELIGQYLALKKDLPLIKMKQRLEDKGLNEKAELFKKLTETKATRSIKVVFELTWVELSQEAQELACFLSLFAIAPIHWSLVEECLSDRAKESLKNIRDKELVKLSLLKRSNKQTYLLNQLVTPYFEAKLENIEIAEQLKSQFCQGIVVKAQKISDTPSKRNLEQINLSIPHIVRLATNFQQWLKDEDLIWPFIGLGKFYQGQKAYKKAFTWFDRCLSETKKRFGDEHPYVAASLNNLAELYKLQGRLDAAEPLYIEALDMTRKLLGLAHPVVATSLNNLAELYKLQDRYSAAEPLYIEALDMRKKLLGLAHPDVATSFNKLAELYELQGRLDAAEPLYINALKIRRKLLGLAHPLVAASLNNLADLYFLQNRYDRAEPLYKQAINIAEITLGVAHPNTLICKENLKFMLEEKKNSGQK